MGIPYRSIGKSNIFNLQQARALREMHDLAAARTAFPAPVSAPMAERKAPAPWRIVPGFDGLCAIFDAENHFVMCDKSALVHRIVESVNEVEGRIEA